MASWKSLGLYMLSGIVTLSVSANANGQFESVKFPADVGIPGFEFPASESTIDGWVATDDTTKIAEHAWGLWAGLNRNSGVTYEKQELRIFETWQEKEQMVADPGSKTPTTRVLTPKPLRQSQRGTTKANRPDRADRPGLIKYNPTAAQHILANKLHSLATLDALVDKTKITKVPDFPNASISVKVNTVKVTDKVGDKYYKLSVWPGPPATPQEFAPEQWNTFVWIDLRKDSKSTGDGSVATGNHVRTDRTTYSLNDFIHFQQPDGHIHVVAAMHVASRETTNWTWQSFWWAPNPENPPAPSSKQIADARPDLLLGMGAPAHYAATLAYSMRTTKNEPIFAYNPYLEGHFNDLGGTYKFGVQSNCMSCHANATHPGAKTDYIGDDFVDIAGSQFVGQVRLDFLYSLEPEASPPPPKE
jgi:hypothetical protein